LPVQLAAGGVNSLEKTKKPIYGRPRSRLKAAPPNGGNCILATARKGSYDGASHFR
jgi:hypothetical protein